MSTTLDRHAVPGQAAGYAYQFDLALAQLSEGTINGRVGIETLDDVARQDSDGATVLVQGKSSVDANAGPYSDRAFGLWNTLHTWAEAIRSGEVEPAKTWFDLITNTAVLPACLARELADAASPDEVSACIEKLRRVPAKPSQKVAPHVMAVRAMPDEVLKALVPRVRCFGRDEGQTVALIHREVVARLKLPSGVDSAPIIEELLGWIKVRVQQKWDAKEPAWIPQEHFNNRLHEAIERHRRRRARELPAGKLVCAEKEIDRHRQSCFVRQLELIDVDEQEIGDAILDLLRHSQERLRLTAEGNIADEEWTEFDQRLVDHWKPIFRKHSRDAAKAQRREAGRAVYSEIQLHRESVAGTPTVEYYLTRGGFHRLSDVLILGWHPDYDVLCKRFRR